MRFADLSGGTLQMSDGSANSSSFPPIDDFNRWPRAA
jgi:hypothetical protein